MATLARRHATPPRSAASAEPPEPPEPPGRASQDSIEQLHAVVLAASASYERRASALAALVERGDPELPSVLAVVLGASDPSFVFRDQLIFAVESVAVADPELCRALSVRLMRHAAAIRDAPAGSEGAL